MIRWVLDTDHVSLLQRGHPVLVSKVAAVNPSEIAVTIITIVEQMYGRLDVIKRAKSKQELVTAYKRKAEVRRQRAEGKLPKNPSGVGLKPTKKIKMYFEMRSTRNTASLFQSHVFKRGFPSAFCPLPSAF